MIDSIKKAYPCLGLPLDSMQSTMRGPVRIRSTDGGFAPKSLFDRRDPKRDLKRAPLIARMSQPPMGKASFADTLAEWLIHEDYSILQSIHKVK